MVSVEDGLEAQHLLVRLHLCELSVNVELARKPSLADATYTATCEWREAFEPDPATGLTGSARHSVTVCADQTTVIAGKECRAGRDERPRRADRHILGCWGTIAVDADV